MPTKLKRNSNKTASEINQSDSESDNTPTPTPMGGRAIDDEPDPNNIDYYPPKPEGDPPEYTKDQFTRVSCMNEGELDIIIKSLPSITDYMTPGALRRLSPNFRTRIGMTPAQQIEFVKNYKERAQLLETYHSYCMELIEYRHKDDFYAALANGLDISWGTMKQRFYDKSITDGATFFDRMKRSIDLRVKDNSASKKRKTPSVAKEKNGDTDAAIDLTSSGSTPSPAVASTTVSPDRQSKKLRSRKKDNPSGSKPSVSPAGSSQPSLQNRSADESKITSAIRDLKETIDSISTASADDVEAVKMAFKVQAEAMKIISNVQVKQEHRLHQANRQVSSIDEYYEAINRDKKELIDNAMAVIDTLYNAYINMARLWHSHVIQTVQPDDLDDFNRYIASVVGALHPRPTPPNRNQNNFNFNRQSDVANLLQLYNGEEITSITANHSYTGRLSVFRFSQHLQRRLTQMGMVPAHGMVRSRPNISDPSVLEMFNRERRILIDENYAAVDPFMRANTDVTHERISCWVNRRIGSWAVDHPDFLDDDGDVVQGGNSKDEDDDDNDHTTPGCDGDDDNDHTTPGCGGNDTVTPGSDNDDVDNSTETGK